MARILDWSVSALQTRLDLYNSELALASSPVLFWNLYVQLEIWISIVICGLAAVVGQASPPPSASPLSSYVTAASCAKTLSALQQPPPPPPTPQYSTLNYGQIYKKYVLCWYYHKKHKLILRVRHQNILWWDVKKGLPVITFYFYQTDHFVSQ